MAFQILKSKIRKTIGRPLPVKLAAALTFMCNSRCKTCHIWKIYKESPDRVKEELTTEDWKKIFDEIGTNLGWIDFTGGEPTLKKDVEDIITYAYNNTAISVASLTTNAILAKRSLHKIKKIVHEIPINKAFNIIVSLDGVSSTHDDIRGVKGNFENAIWLFNELKKLKKQYCNLTVSCGHTISEYNAGKFWAFYHFLKKNHISIREIIPTLEHFTEYYGKNFNENSYESFKKDLIDDFNYYLKMLINETRSKNIIHKVKSLFYRFYSKKIPAFLNDPQKMIVPCVAATYSAFIDPYGNVYPCTQWSIKLGNLKEKNFRDIWWG
ncbi:radical SAM protein, partial [Candidatus Borrarchaeum sp.]|uniref:radical SAM protein n=1 Tax=Candidatus Borrarchaeum sp. TaxID=2846742 RepID=UPI00257C2BCB